MQSKSQDWARAYAKQALSDLDAREKLANAGADKCHRLHFLQMAAEKACKAHLHQNDNMVRKSHAYVARNLPVIARHFYSIHNNNQEMAAHLIGQIRFLSKEIEVLAPACDHGDVRKDNSEYPWEDGSGKVQIPCEYNFSNIDDGGRAVVTVIKLIRTACESYIQ